MPTKEIASLDSFSNGRFHFGIGAGWNREEAEILGVDFEHRWSQVREAIEVMKTCWVDDESEYHGKYYDFPPVLRGEEHDNSPHNQDPQRARYTGVGDHCRFWRRPSLQ